MRKTPKGFRLHIGLFGRRNVGKSSLLNALLARPRALVTDVAGTTRDILEEPLAHRGVPLNLLDTAGLRDPLDEVEALGIGRTLEALQGAALALFVVDGSRPLDGDDERVASRLEGLPHLTVVNKSDLPSPVADEALFALSPTQGILRLSARTGDGIDSLKETIVDAVVASGLLDEGLNASAFQLDELRRALEGLDEARDAAVLGLDLAASSLIEARLALENVVGPSEESLLERIFNRFCVGK